MAKNDIEYRAIKVPDGKDPKDYHYTERRAEILGMVEETGNPRFAKRVDLADRYGVSSGQITHDFDALREYINDNVGANAKAMTESFLYKVIDKANEEDDPEMAFNALMRFNDWLQSTGKQERAPAKAEIEQTMIDGEKSGSYEIIADDDEVDGEVVEVGNLRVGSAESRQDAEAENE